VELGGLEPRPPSLLLALPESMRHLRRATCTAILLSASSRRHGGEPFDGVAEMLFESLEDRGRAFALPCYRERIRPDEERFLDLPRCAALVVTEAEMHDARGRT